jgi:hypothetical protein
MSVEPGRAFNLPPMNSHVIDCGELWLGDGTSVKGHVVIANGRIEAVRQGAYRGAQPRAHFPTLALSPGLIDLQVCGAFGQGAMLGRLDELSREYLRLGVTGYQVCSGNATWDVYEKTAANVRAAMSVASTDRSTVLGLYSEGPFIQPESAGGNRADLCQPATRRNVGRFLEICGSSLATINVSPGIKGDCGSRVTAPRSHSFARREKSSQCATPTRLQNRPANASMQAPASSVMLSTIIAACRARADCSNPRSTMWRSWIRESDSFT